MLLKRDLKTGNRVSIVSTYALNHERDEYSDIKLTSTAAYPSSHPELELKNLDRGCIVTVVATTSDKTIFSAKGKRNFIPCWAVVEVLP